MAIQEKHPQRTYRPVWYRSLAFYIGLFSLVASVYTWFRLPSTLSYCFSAQNSPPQYKHLGWLLHLGLPWSIWVGLEAIALIGWAIGTALIGIGLLLRGRRVLAAGLIAIAPATIVDILLIPGRVAIMLGRITYGADLRDPLALKVLALMGSGLLIASLIGAVYFWFVWRNYRRMSAEE